METLKCFIKLIGQPIIMLSSDEPEENIGGGFLLGLVLALIFLITSLVKSVAS